MKPLPPAGARVKPAAPTTADLRALLEPREPPCISIYQPTHPSWPESRQDPVRFRNLIAEVERSLRERYSARDAAAPLAQLAPFADDFDFWASGGAGIALFLSPGEEMRQFALPRAVPALARVADSFHVKPLVRVLQSADRFHLLAVTLDHVKLFEGDRDSLGRVELAGVPQTLTEALGEELTEPVLRVTRSAGGGPAGPAPLHFGQGARKDEVDLDRDRFFRAVDRAIHERYSKPTGLPLILAALPEHQTHFRRLSHNRQLLERGIAIDPESQSPEQLRAAAWAALEPLYLERLAALAGRFGQARAHARGSDDVREVARAAVDGRIARLLIEAERTIPGRLDASGNVELHERADAASDDLLDDLAEAVLRRSGEVIVVPAARMPTGRGLAAEFRY